MQGDVRRIVCVEVEKAVAGGGKNDVFERNLFGWLDEFGQRGLERRIGRRLRANDRGQQKNKNEKGRGMIGRGMENNYSSANHSRA